MIIKSNEVPTSPEGRKPYELGGREIQVKHFVTRVTRPENPFGPHEHQQSELWYIIDGHALVRLGQVEEKVTVGDLIIIDPWVEHGLRTDSEATWICLG
jgi:mannose-6-phosphate isomerase-like protein (cupin superfamily)